MPSSDSKRSQAYKVATCGVFCAVALVLSYVEGGVPLGALLGIPGVKLGLANIATVVVFYRVGICYAALVSVLRILISSLLFGSVTSFAFSLCGGTLSFLVLILTYRIYGKYIGLIGVSVLCAAAHNIGQIFSAFVLMREPGVFLYLPTLLIAAIPCGAVTGIMSALLMRAISKNKIGDIV